MLKDWPKLVTDFRKSYDTRMAAPNETPIPVISSSSTQEQKYLHTGVHNLLRAHRRQVGKNYLKMMFNIDILVFCLWWFGAVWTIQYQHILWLITSLI